MVTDVVEVALIHALTLAWPLPAESTDVTTTAGDEGNVNEKLYVPELAAAKATKPDSTKADCSAANAKLCARTLWCGYTFR